MNQDRYKVLNVDDGNGHEWFEIIDKDHSFCGKTICRKCGYFRRADIDGKSLNKQCKGPVHIALR